MEDNNNDNDNDIEQFLDEEVPSVNGPSIPIPILILTNCIEEEKSRE